jgi:hypothetical protein
MSKAAPLTRVHTRSEQERIIHPEHGSKYSRAQSPGVVHGVDVGTKTDNVRGRYSEPDETGMASDRELRARANGRRNKLTAQVAALRKFR